jgi:hypothetical protein
MADLGELEQCRTELYARLAALEGFRAGSISETWRRDGKPNCAYAQQGILLPDPVSVVRPAGGRTYGHRLGSGDAAAASGHPG